MQTAMGQDLAHKRPWLAASLLAGLSYPATWLLLPIEGNIFGIIWKMAAVSCLVPYALRRHSEGEFAHLAIILAIWALGDGLLELSMFWGGLTFAIGHFAAIALFLKHRRVSPVLSQTMLAVAVFVLAPVIAYFLPADPAMRLQAVAYTLIVSGMAAAAWNSNFPRYRVGIGAMAFVVSDLLIFARMGPLAETGWVGLAIWLLYYGGVLMVTTGVVTTLVKRGHFSEG